MPQRIRVRVGERRPPDAVPVHEPTMWANPWKVGSTGWTVNPDRTINREPHPPLTAAQAVESYRNDRATDPGEVEIIRHLLRGRDLACRCALDQPCHADVLLEIANRDEDVDG
jgi:hypothetical protein